MVSHLPSTKTRNSSPPATNSRDADPSRERSQSRAERQALRGLGDEEALNLLSKVLRRRSTCLRCPKDLGNCSSALGHGKIWTQHRKLQQVDSLWASELQAKGDNENHDLARIQYAAAQLRRGCLLPSSTLWANSMPHALHLLLSGYCSLCEKLKWQARNHERDTQRLPT